MKEVDNYPNIEDIVYYAFCKMLSACDIYAQKTYIPTFFHRKGNLYLQIVFVMEYSSWFYLNLF
jgi:hypothetical protein